MQRPSGRPRDCFFCAYVRQKSKDRKNHVLLRGRTCFIVLNLYPYTTGHLLIAPLAHKASPADLSPAERAEIFDLLVLAQRTIDRALRPHGHNIGLNLGEPAGAGVPGHLHFHIVPRWRGDANFMTTVGNARVIPQSLASVYAELQKALPRSR